MADSSVRSILMIHRYYHPDAPPYAHFLRDIAGWLTEAGYEVFVLSSQPSYNPVTARARMPIDAVEGGIRVHRMRLLPERKDQMARRAVNTALFLVAVFIHVARRHDDLVTFSTMPPVALGLTVRVALAITGRAGQFVYHCQDLYPEASSPGGVTSPMHRLLRRVDASTVASSAATIVLSEDMRRTVRRRGVASDNVQVINNYPQGPEPSAEDRLAAAALLPARPRPVVLFAGNLGRFQQLDVVIAAAHALDRRGEPATFVFMGEGAVRTRIASDAGALLGRRVHLVGYQASEVAAAAMELADVGLVTLREGLLDAAYPSKTLAYLRNGCPVLVTAPSEKALAETVRLHDLGRVCPPGDSKALADTILAMGVASRAAREAARQYVRDHASPEQTRAAWLRLMTDLEEDQ